MRMMEDSSRTDPDVAAAAGGGRVCCAQTALFLTSESGSWVFPAEEALTLLRCLSLVRLRLHLVLKDRRLSVILCLKLGARLVFLLVESGSAFCSWFASWVCVSPNYFSGFKFHLKSLATILGPLNL